MSAAIFYAVDYDANPAAVKPYFEGVADVAQRRVGVYGSYRVVEYLVDRKLVALGWQTLAWSQGRWSEKAQVQQYAIERTLGGCDVDYNRATASEWGAW